MTTQTAGRADLDTVSTERADRGICATPTRHLVDVELRKMFDTRSGFWLLISIGALAVVATAAAIIFAPESELSYDTFAKAIGFPMTLVLPIIAILAVTSEWSQRSGLTTFTLVPSRGRVIAAKAVALGEALAPEFKAYQRQVLDNARVMATVLRDRGLRIVSGGTDSHMFLVDLRPKKLTGKEAEAALSRAHITVNKNAIPNDPEKPFVTSGIRIGSPAVTTRGFTELECEELAHLIADVLDKPDDESTTVRVKAGTAVLTSKFPVYG